MKSDVNKLLKKNAQRNHLDAAKVITHVQRESGDWVITVSYTHLTLPTNREV